MFCNTKAKYSWVRVLSYHARALWNSPSLSLSLSLSLLIVDAIIRLGNLKSNADRFLMCERDRTKRKKHSERKKRLLQSDSRFHSHSLSTTDCDIICTEFFPLDPPLSSAVQNMPDFQQLVCLLPTKSHSEKTQQ